MKIAVFGGTGRTGIHVAEKALAAGHEVAALVRSPEKMRIQDGKLMVIEGEVRDKSAVARTIQGADAVISALTPVREAMELIIAVMKEENVQRLIVTAGAGVYQEGDAPPFISKVISTFIKTFSRDAFEATVEVTELVKRSNLDWTLARAPRLINKPATGNLYIGPLNSKMKATLSREDYANFLVEQVGKDIYIGRTPVVSDK